MERRYRELVSIYRRMLIKFIITSNKERIYLKRCGIRAPKRHLKHIIEHKVFKKLCPKNSIKRMLKSKRRVHRKLTRKGWKKLAKFSFKVRVTTKDIMKLGCKRKVLIKHIIKKKKFIIKEDADVLETIHQYVEMGLLIIIIVKQENVLK